MKRIVFAFLLSMSALVLILQSSNQPTIILLAQDDMTPTVVVHVIETNETLAQIAAQYGTTTDAIMNANNISDARFIEVGQTLVIPNAQPATVTNGFRHIVALNDTLPSIAAQYGTSVRRLIELNHIVHPNRLYIGQPLIIGETAPRQANYGYYTVENTDTALAVAARFGMTLDELTALNHLQAPFAVFSGQRLLVRGATDPTSLPIPLSSLRLSSSAPIQGQTVSIRFTSSDEITSVQGTFLERPFTVVHENEYYYGIVAVHSFTPAGVYQLELAFETDTGKRYRDDIRLWVGDGGYDSEAINIPEDRSDLLEPSLVQSELDRVAAVMSGFDSTRYFDGTMILPATGAITSNYGTRRSYNGSPYNTFHGGTDFGGGVGAPITAPADGVVVLAEPLIVRGNVVILDHGWGVYTGYWHLSEIGVQTGQQVQKGEVLGLLGATGLVTGAHLHWEMWVQGVQVDPMQWVQQAFP